MPDAVSSDPIAPSPTRYAVFVVSEDWYLVSHRLPLIRECRRLGIRPVAITNVNRHRGTIEAAGARVIEMKLVRSGMNPFADIPYAFRLWLIYFRLKPMLVHHVALKPALYGSIAARLACTPCVVNELAGRGFLGRITAIRAPGFQVAAKSWYWLIGGILNSRRALLVVQNRADQKFAMRELLVDEDRIELVPGVGADADRFTPSTRAAGARPLTVTLMTRMLWSKGVGEVVAAARELRRAGRAIDFHLVGGPDPSNPDSVSAHTLKEWHDEGVIVYHGFRSDVEVVWKDADIAILPTYYAEGVPKALLEAAMSGLPIITTNTPGCDYVVEDGVNGLLIPQRDASAIVAAVQTLADSPTLRERMGKASRAFALANFTSQTMVQRTFAVYRRGAASIGDMLNTGPGKPRVLLAIPSVTSYFTFLSELAEEMLRQGYELHIAASPQHLRGVDCYGPLPAGTLHAIDFPRGGNIFAHLHASRQLRRLVREFDPDIMHLHFSATVFCAALAKEKWWPRTLATIHGGIFPQATRLKSRFFRRLEGWCYRRMDGVWMLNESDRVAYSQLPGLAGRTHCYPGFGIGCRVDDFRRSRIPPDEARVVRRECGFAPDDVVFVFIGRCVHFKGFGVTVKAFFELHREMPKTKLLVVGEFDRLHPSGLSKAEISLFSAHPGVKKIGWTADIARYLAAVDVNVFPSVREGMPVNIMESLAMGIPVITLDTRGCRDIVNDGIDGVVLKAPGNASWVNCPPEVKIRAVLAAMRRLTKNSSERKRFAEAAQARHAEFDRRRWIDHQIRIYRAVLEGQFQ